MKSLRSFQFSLWSARVLRVAVALCASLVAACGGGGYGGGSSMGGSGGMSSSAPMITNQPADMTVHANGMATAMFSVTASNPSTYAGAEITYQWMRNSMAISGATLASYTTSPVTMADNGATFAVVVGNVYGHVTNRQALLTVN